MRLVEVKVADAWLVWSFFRLLDGLLELLLQQVGFVLFGVYSLAKQGFLAPFLLAHGFGGRIKIGKSLGLDGSNVGDHCAGRGVYLQHRPTARAANFKRLCLV